MKEQRWYENHGDGWSTVHNEPIPELSTSCSIVRTEDLNYYRNAFELKKVWEQSK